MEDIDITIESSASRKLVLEPKLRMPCFLHNFFARLYSLVFLDSPITPDEHTASL